MRPWLALLMFAGLILVGSTLRQESLAAETYPQRMECIVAPEQVTLNRYNKDNHVASYAFKEDGLRYRLKRTAGEIYFVTYSELEHPYYDRRDETSGLLYLRYRSGSIFLWERMSQDCYSALMDIYPRA